MADATQRLNAALEGRYEIERELGEGGMATVYLADDLRHERKVALKVLKPELAAVVGAERFLGEIKTTANLQHPHILPLYDSGEADGLLFYVMPYVEEESLRERLDREHQLPVDDAIRIATNMAEALDYAHRQGVIHRDIKPANVLLQDGKPVISDFGIALAVSAGGGARLTETGLSLGTPHYMSPEQATGDQNVGPATDIYALGCVLYEMLVGEPPFTGSTAQAVLGKIIAGQSPSAKAERGSVPQNVDAVISSALEKVPADRFGTAKDFARALVDDSFRHLAASTPSGRLERKASPRLAAVFAVVAVLTTATAIWIGTWPAPPQRVARYNQDISLAPGGSSRRSRIALSPDGQILVFRSPEDNRLWRRQSDELDATPIAGTELAVNPFFSPDGTKIAFQVPSLSGLRVVPLSGGQPTTFGLGQVGISGTAWGPDDLIYSAASDSLQAVHADLGLIRIREGGTGSWERVTTLMDGELDHKWPHPLPNGDGALFTVTYADGRASEIAVVELPQGRHRTVLTGVAARYASSGHLLYVTESGDLLAVGFDIRAMEVEPTTPVPLDEGLRVGSPPHNAVDLALSSDGRLVYVVVGVSGGLMPVWVEGDGNYSEVEPGWTVPAVVNGGLDLLGDSALVIDGYDPAARRSDVYIKSLTRHLQTRLTFEGDNRRPVWSHGGRSVTFISSRTGKDAVWQRPVDGSAPPSLLLERERAVFEALWSPDNTWLVYRTDDDGAAGSGDILAIRPGIDSAPRELVATDFEETSPTISPNGRWMAYSSARFGFKEVFVQPFLDSGGGRWQISEGGGTEPAWSTDGRTLFYRDRTGRMVAADLLEQPFSVEQRRVLFDASRYHQNDDHRWYAVGAGERFLMLRPDEAPTLTLVENFFTELERLVPN